MVLYITPLNSDAPDTSNIYVGTPPRCVEQ